MQTFLPYAHFRGSAYVLDRQRLGKQRVEAKQILNALANGGGWSNHPAVKMWAGHEYTLAIYGDVMCSEWIARGYNDSLRPFFVEASCSLPATGPPWWLGRKEFHSAHRAALLAKDFEYYKHHGWDEKPVINYWWPTHHEETH
jgi:hypothetical protein